METKNLKADSSNLTFEVSETQGWQCNIVSPSSRGVFKVTMTLLSMPTGATGWIVNVIPDDSNGSNVPGLDFYTKTTKDAQIVIFRFNGNEGHVHLEAQFMTAQDGTNVGAPVRTQSIRWVQTDDPGWQNNGLLMAASGEGWCVPLVSSMYFRMVYDPETDHIKFLPPITPNYSTVKDLERRATKSRGTTEMEDIDPLYAKEDETWKDRDSGIVRIQIR